MKYVAFIVGFGLFTMLSILFHHDHDDHDHEDEEDDHDHLL